MPPAYNVLGEARLTPSGGMLMSQIAGLLATLVRYA